MARTTATQQQILEVIRARLIKTVPEWTEDTCFLSDHPAPLRVPAGDTFCTITPGDGQFPEAFFAGGGTITLNESTELMTTIYTMERLDESDRFHSVMLGKERGLISYFKQRVLRSLLISDDGTTQWEPTLGGNELLRNMLRPLRCTAPQSVDSVDQIRFVQLSITWEIDFDWSL